MERKDNAFAAKHGSNRGLAVLNNPNQFVQIKIDQPLTVEVGDAHTHEVIEELAVLR
jgi:hypothetical protein